MLQFGKKILLIEDNPGDADLIMEKMEEGKREFNFQWVETITAALEKLKVEKFDAVLLDLSLPDSMGMDSLNYIQNAKPELPVIILTSLANEAFAVSAIKTGAQDYISKNEIDKHLLTKSINYAIERKKMEIEIRYREFHFSNIIEKNADSILIVSLDGIIQYANPSSGDVFGCDHQQLFNQPIGVPLVPKKPTQINITKKDGKAITAEIRAEKIEWEGKESFLASVRDVTLLTSNDGELSLELATLKNQVEILEKSLESATKEKEQLRIKDRELKSLQREMEFSKINSEKLENNIQSLEDEKKQLEIKIDEYNNLEKGLDSDFESIMSERDKLRGELEEKEREMSLFKQEGTLAGNKFQNLQKKFDDLSREKTEIEEHIRELTNAERDAQGKIEKLDTEKTALIKELKEKNETEKVANETIDELRNNIQDLNKRILEAQESEKRLREQMSTKGDEVSNINFQIKSMKDELEQKGKVLAEKEKEIQQLGLGLDLIQQNMDKSDELMEEEKKKYSLELADLQKENDRLEGENESLASQLAQIISQKNKNSLELDELRDQNAEMEMKLETLSSQKETFDSDQNEKDRIIQSLTSSLEDYKMKQEILEKEKEDLGMEVEQRKKELGKIKTEIDERLNDMGVKDEEFFDLKGQIETLKEDTNKTKVDLDEQSDFKDQFKKENRLLKDQTIRLTERITELERENAKYLKSYVRNKKNKIKIRLMEGKILNRDRHEKEFSRTIENIDNLLLQLPQEIIQDFVNSPDFASYQKLVSRYVKKNEDKNEE